MIHFDTFLLILFKSQLIYNLYLLYLNMNHQYDFDEQHISQKLPIISIPKIQPLISSRIKNTQANMQTLKNIEFLLQQTKNKERQRVKQLQAKQKFIGEQVNRQQLKKQQKIKEIEAQQKQKMLKQCTFKPNIKNKGSRRGLEQFLEDQNDHVKKVQAKKRNLKMGIESELQYQTFRPKINQTTAKNRKNIVPVHQRLYALKDKENIPQNIQQLNLQNTFHPNISKKSKKMSREAPIQELLYEDALRRQEKNKDIINTQPSENSKPQKAINLNNEKYVAQRFIREYFSILEKLQINLSIHYKIDYIMFNEILKFMGFIKQDQELQDPISVNQRGLVYEAYSIIQKFGVNARNVCVFLLGLVGVYHINPINFQEGEESVTEKQFNLDEAEGRKMQKHFDILFRNRLNCEKYKKTDKSNPEPTFQPKINKKSEGLAQKYRSHMLEEANELLENYPELEYSIPEDGIISHTELLVLHRMAKQVQRKKAKQQSEMKNMEQYTFKPSTLSSMNQTMKNSKASNFDSKLGQKKSFQLYNYSKSLQSKKESLRVSRQVDDAECTFAPNLKKEKVSTTTPYAKQIDQTLYRMHKGRQEKQEKQKFLSRGEKTSQVENLKDADQEEPTLILDVNLGDKTDRIVLFRDDEHKLHQVAFQFAKKHNLDEESKDKLLQLLKIELNNVLQKIEEGNEFDDLDNQE